MRKFQHQFAVLPLVDGGEQPAVAAVRQHLLEHEIIDDLARRWQLQNGQGLDRMGQFVAIGGRQIDHIEHQRRHVVAAAGGERGINQRARRFFRRRALAQ